MEETPKHPQQLPLLNQSVFSSCIDRRDGGHSRTDFPEGMLVEVKTKEEGFSRVYFSATVLPSKVAPKKGSKQKSNKIFVEYHNLLARDDGLDRLQEHVDVSFVRPILPFQEIVKGFEPNDVVDAFFRDGWWIGVVARVVKKGESESYVVTFQDPPDELELRLDELRVHWDWVDGTWVPPGNQSIAGNMFDVGNEVEVSFDKAECLDAWFPATIHKDLGNGSFLVECKNVNADDKSQPCEVTINCIRPRPPLLKGTKIRLLEKVDAHIDSGWWNGTTIKVLENSRYNVFFKRTKLQKEFDSCDLRPHVEWTEGKWFAGSKEITVRSSIERTRVRQTPKKSNASAPTVPVNKLGDRIDTRDAKTPLTSKKGHFQQLTPENQNGTSSLTKRNQPLSDSRNALSQSLEKVKEGDVLKASQQDSRHKPVKEMSCGPVIPLSVDISATLNATGDQLSDNPSWGKKFQRKQRTVGAILNVDGEINSTTSNMKKCSMPMLQVDIPILDFGVTVPSSVGNTAEGVQNDKKEETKRPVIIGLPYPKMGGSGHEILRGKRRHCPNSKETMIIASEKKQKLNGSPIQERKDGEPLENGDSSDKTKRGRPRRVLIRNNQTPMIDSAGASGGELTEVNPNNMEVEKVICESVSNVFDDEPLSKWIEELQPPSAIEYSRLPPESNTQQCMESCEKQIDVIVIEDDVENIQESGTLPFVKNTILWKTIESIEVFKKVPQRPHFKPLQQFKESSREGLAIGYMVTFVTVVEKASSLYFNHPKSTTDEILETLVDLERNGFDVQFVRDRVNGLLSAKDKEEKLVLELKEVNGKISEQNREKSKIEEEISKLQDKLSSAISAKGKKDGEIASLRARVKETEERIRNVRSDFEGNQW